MAQQTVINYNYLNIKDKNTNEIISSRFVSTVLKWEESNNDYTIIKTGDSNYLFLHDKKYIETTTGKKSGITFNIFYFKRVRKKFVELCAQVIADYGDEL